LFSIHILIEYGVRDFNVSPTVYALLLNKIQSTYSHLINNLLKIKPTLKLSLIIMNFKQASINAFQTVFTQSHHYISMNILFFIYHSVFGAKIQKFGLAEKYITNSEYAINLRMLIE